MQRFFLGLIIMLMVACTAETQQSKEWIHGEDIAGLIMPVRLQHDTTRIHLSDFVSDPTTISLVVLNEDTLHAVDGIVTVIGNIPHALGALHLSLDEIEYTVPVIASTKQEYRFTYTATNADIETVQLAGNINGWNPSATNLEKNEGQWTTTLWLSPGVYQYQVVEDGAWMLDHNNADQMSNGMGGFNSTFTVGDPTAKKPFVKSRFENNKITIELADSTMDYMVLLDNQELETTRNREFVYVEIPESVKKINRAILRVWAAGDLLANDLLIPIQNGVPISDAAQLTRADRQSMIMYFLMVDRFRDGNPENTLPVQNDSILPKANHFGGDFTGISDKITDGYFSDLGVNTIWISPITQNAEGAWGLWNKGVTSRFSGYHGYWPISSTQIDYHFGDETSFLKLIDDCHSKDMNILVDYVANHVHIEHPIYVENPDWATDLYLPDGTMNTEKWDEHRLTTWFDTHLPTLDFSREEVIDAMTDSALYWVQNYNLDGFRHDATKHIQKAFWRALTSKIKAEVSKQGKDPLFQIGETYGNPELISSYMDSGQLDSQFDFNLYDAAVDAFAKEGSGYENLSRVLNESLDWYGSHHLMGNITGNQDRARFISYADGSVDFAEDPKLAGWTREINNNGDIGFYRLERLMAFLMTAPGIPCIFYGDEIGMPGANDPDNRRMMVFENLDSSQQSMLNATKKLINLRKSNMALMYGSTGIIEANEEFMLFERSYLGETVLVAFAEPGFQLETGYDENWIGLKPSFGGQAELNAKEMFLSLTMGKNGYDILTR